MSPNESSNWRALIRSCESEGSVNTPISRMWMSEDISDNRPHGVVVLDYDAGN